MFTIKKFSFLRWYSQIKDYVSRLQFRGFPVIPGLIIFLFVFIACFGEFLAPYPSSEMNLSSKFLPPLFLVNGSMAHPLGTDMLGRDMLSRILVGARPSLIVAVTVIVLGGLGGSALGIISGYFRGAVDVVLMRTADSIIAFPVILAAMLLAVLLGPSLQNVIISISVIIWSSYARVIRGETLSLMEEDYVALARVAGASSLRIMFHHILPNVAHTIIVMVTLQVGVIIILEAALSFLGAGVPPPTPVWGGLIARGREYLTTAWWISFFPGMALALVVLSFNMLGDWLREVLDPKLRQV